MRIHESRRKQYRASANQRRQMVEQFRRSGLSRRAYSREHGIPISTLSWWLRKTKPASSLPIPIEFSEVMAMPPSTKKSGVWAMELVSPSGLTIRYREALATSDLMLLLRESRC
jgi:hypothetical protein